MTKENSFLLGRREVLKTSAIALGSSLLGAESAESFPQGVTTNSSPSRLNITDLRVATLGRREVLKTSAIA